MHSPERDSILAAALRVVFAFETQERTGSGDSSPVARPVGNVSYQSKIPVVSGAGSFDRWSDSHNGSFGRKRRKSGLGVGA